MPGQHVVDLAEIDVAGDRALLGPLEVDLRDLVVLEHGDALLADVDGHEQLALRGRQRRAARRLAAAARRTLGAAAFLPLGHRLALAGCVAGLLLAFAPSAFAAPERPPCARSAGLSALSARRRGDAPAVPGFLRPRPPRLPRRRLGRFGSVVASVAAPVAAAGGTTVGRVESQRLEGQQAVKPLRRRIHSSVDGTRASENSFVGARVGDAGSSSCTVP